MIHWLTDLFTKQFKWSHYPIDLFAFYIYFAYTFSVWMLQSFAFRSCEKI